MPKTHKERRKASKDVYLAVRSKNPHRHRSLEEASSAGQGVSGVCPQCDPILSRYSETIKGMVHQGSQLKQKSEITY